MKKRFISAILLIIIAITMLSLTACSDDEGPSVENKTESSKEETKDESGKRSNPINLGETVEWEVKFYADLADWDALNGLAKVTLNKVYKAEEAIDMLYFGHETLEDVEEGYTFAVADYTVELLEGDEDAPYTTSFQIGSVSVDGRKSPFAYASLGEGHKENEYTDLYPGGSVDIKQAFLVPKEGDYLIEIEENISGVKFFKHE